MRLAFGLLRYFLGGYRPSQTARLTLSDSQFHERSLDFRLSKTGISRLTPQTLTSPFLCLPVILHMESRSQYQSTWKFTGSFRLVAVNGIFTRYYNFTESPVETVPRSLGHSCRSELTDKEFRYLRTVIVTAAIHQGLNSTLS